MPASLFYYVIHYIGMSNADSLKHRRDYTAFNRAVKLMKTREILLPFAVSRAASGAFHHLITQRLHSLKHKDGEKAERN